MMVSISCLVFTIQLVVALAVFDKNEIISKLANSNLLTWNIKENSSKKIEPELIHLGPKNIDFNPTNAYIVLEHAKSEKNLVYKIYYLISEKSDININLKTVEYVIELQNSLTGSAANLEDKISVTRETYNQESPRFKVIFPRISARKNPKSISPQRLYRVSKINEKIRFQQVPLHFSELNTSDVFVFDNSPLVILFSVKSELEDHDVVSSANKIGLFINFENIHKKVCDTLSLWKCLNWWPGNDSCYLQFLKKLEGCPEEQNTIDKILKNKTEEIHGVSDYQLLSPVKEKTMDMDFEFMVESLETFDFTAKVCYVFIFKKVEEAFIYIRNFTNIEQVERCLKFGEKFAVKSKYRVSVLHKAYPSTPFIFIFEKFWPFIFHGDIGVSEFKKYINHIAAELP